MSVQLSQPHKTTGKIIVLYISIFTLLGSKLEDSGMARPQVADGGTASRYGG
jgi:hypothetical protein